MLQSVILQNCHLPLRSFQRGVSRLLACQSYINGSWVESSDCKVFPVNNPATGECIAMVPDMTMDDVQRAIDAAYRAFKSPEWMGLTVVQRSNLLKAWYKLLNKNSLELAKLVTAESGKALDDAKGEVAYGNSFIEWFAEEARRINGEIITAPVNDREILVIKQPVGVAGMITPWNFPLTMITRKAGAALAAGCTIVVKPAEFTPLTGLAAVKLADEAGFPKGVINMITTTKASDVGNLFCTSPKVRAISFTGSTRVGSILFQNSAGGIKRLSLELGGNAPFIVFNSGNIAKAVNGAMASKFRNCGQTCVSPNRFFVQNGAYSKFLKLLKTKVAALKIGPGDEKGVDIGPLINHSQLEKIEMLMDDARCKNAKIIYGGKQRCDIGELFYDPTIIIDVNPSMKLYTEEIFGPLIAVINFKSEEDVMKMANDTERGLAGYFYSRDVQQIFRVARKLETGMVGVNESMISTAEAPFGGVKLSGIGREASHFGIDEYVNIKYICLGSMKY